jgi:pyruvate kinase
MYRGVGSVFFEITHKDSRSLYQDVFSALLANKIVDAGDLVIFTQGDLDGVSGSTNAMKIIEVTAES